MWYFDAFKHAKVTSGTCILRGTNIRHDRGLVYVFHYCLPWICINIDADNRIRTQKPTKMVSKYTFFFTLKPTYNTFKQCNQKWVQ